MYSCREPTSEGVRFFARIGRTHIPSLTRRVARRSFSRVFGPNSHKGDVSWENSGKNRPCSPVRTFFQNFSKVTTALYVCKKCICVPAEKRTHKYMSIYQHKYTCVRAPAGHTLPWYTPDTLLNVYAPVGCCSLSNAMFGFCLSITPAHVVPPVSVPKGAIGPACSTFYPCELAHTAPVRADTQIHICVLTYTSMCICVLQTQPAEH